MTSWVALNHDEAHYPPTQLNETKEHNTQVCNVNCLKLTHTVFMEQ